MESHIIEFLRGDKTDLKGRKLIHLQSLSDEQIERSHDVIQWMFPTDLPSQHSPTAPVLTNVDILIMRSDPDILTNIQMSLMRMIWFFENNEFWLTQKNHNYKRITRILRCLWLVGLKHDYVCLQKALDDVFIENADIIGEEAYLFWKQANNDEFIKTAHEQCKKKRATFRKETKKDWEEEFKYV